MKSKKPFLSRELIYNNIRRFWWISVLYVLALFLVSPLIALTNGSDTIPKSGYNITFGDIYDGTMIFLFTVPVFIGVMVFRYMQNSKSMVCMHSMPYTRLRLYVNNAISGLILLITPILLNAAFLSAIQLGNLGGTYFREGIVLQYLATSLLTGVTLYIWTIFAGMFTGSSIAQIIFTYIINFLVPGIILLVQAVLSGIIYGFVINEDICLEFISASPIIQAMAGSSVLDTGKTLTDFLIIDLIICTILFVVGYFVYKYRNLETAGDVISGKYIKPVFKYGVTACVMLVGVVYVREIFSIDNVNIFIYLLFALLGYIVAEMLLRKSFKIWDSYKGFLWYSFILIVALLGVKLDVAGYERYVPNMDEVVAVSLNLYADFESNDNYAVLDEEENINRIINLNKNILEDKELNLVKDSYRYKEDIGICYKLNNGKIVKRSYTVPDDKYTKKLNEIYDSKEYIISTNTIFDYELDDIYSARIFNTLLGSELYVLVNSKVEIDKLFTAVKEDVLSMTREKAEQYASIYRVSFTVESDEDDNNTVTAEYYYDDTIFTEQKVRSISKTFNINAENINNFIIENGYYNELMKLDDITSIKLRYNDSDKEVKEITDKENISKVIDGLINTPKDTDKKHNYEDYVSFEIILNNRSSFFREMKEENVKNIIEIFG